MAELVERPGPAVDDVAEEDLAVGEVQVAADDQVVAGAVGVGKLVADAVAGDVGVAADGDAALDVAVERLASCRMKALKSLATPSPVAGTSRAFQGLET